MRPLLVSMARTWRIGRTPYFQGLSRAGLIILGAASGVSCSSSENGVAADPFAGFFSGGAPAIAQPTLAHAGSGGWAASLSGNGGAGGSSVLPDPCAMVPEGRLALIDDFEDANQDAVPEANREAYWFPLKDDEASTGILVPEKEFHGGVAGGANGSSQAAHITASGFTVWGAAFAANISYLKDGIRFPYNASHFSGYRFFARGSGRVYVALQIPDIIDEQYGGTCRPSAGDTCYDAHGVWIALTPDWKAYSFKWSDFMQRSFGKRAAFRPGAIMSLQFSFEKEQLPVDFWLDDVGWDDGSPFAVTASGGTGGTGELGGSGGLGGTGGLDGTSGQAGAGGNSGGAGGSSGLGGASGAEQTGAAGSGGRSGAGGADGGAGGKP